MKNYFSIYCFYLKITNKIKQVIVNIGNSGNQRAVGNSAGICLVGSNLNVKKMECIRYEREELPYEDLSNRFKLNSRDFNRQYAHIYATRLMKFQSLLQYRVLEKWGMKRVFLINLCLYSI